MAASLLLLLIPGLGLFGAETWTDASGTFRVEADFLALRGDTLYLKKANGVTIAVPLSRLSAESQQLARQLGAAPATPAPAADTPEGAARALKESLDAGNFRAIWDALPASYQKDVHEVVHAFAENMDAQLWNTGGNIAKKAVRVLKVKKQFVLGHPALAAAPNMGQLAGQWDGIVGVLETIVESDLTDLSKLKKLDVGVFLDDAGKKLGQQLAAIAEKIDQQQLPIGGFPGMPVESVPNLKDAKFTTVSVDGDQAKLRVETAEKTEEIDLVRVEGKWLPKEMVDQWSEGIEAAKTFVTTQMGPQIQQNKPQMLFPMQMVENVADQLLAAKTQDEFNTIINGVMQLLGMGAAGGPGGGLPPGGPGDGNPGAPAGGVDPFGRTPGGN